MRLIFDETGILGHYEATDALTLGNEELFRLLREKLTGRVKIAFVFGSRATGTYHAASDLDLILVAETKLRFFDRREEFEDLFDLIGELDLLVYTPEEFSKISTDRNDAFWREVKDRAIRII